jgi:hypothetical protein
MRDIASELDAVGLHKLVAPELRKSA